MQKGGWMEKRKVEKSQVIKALEYSTEIEGEVRTLRGLIKELGQCYDTSSGISYDGMPKGKNHLSNPTEKTAMNIPDFVRKDIRNYTEKIAQLQKFKCEIVKEVLRLPLKQKQTIMMFYFKKLKWMQIADELHYSERQCKNIRDNALDQLAENFGNNYIIANFEIKE